MLTEEILGIFLYEALFWKVMIEGFCHTPSLQPGGDWHSRTIVDPKESLTWLTYSAKDLTREEKYF